MTGEQFDASFHDATSPNPIPNFHVGLWFLFIEFKPFVSGSNNQEKDLVISHFSHLFQENERPLFFRSTRQEHDLEDLLLDEARELVLLVVLEDLSQLSPLPLNVVRVDGDLNTIHHLSVAVLLRVVDGLSDIISIKLLGVSLPLVAYEDAALLNPLVDEGDEDLPLLFSVRRNAAFLLGKLSLSMRPTTQRDSFARTFPLPSFLV